MIDARDVSVRLGGRDVVRGLSISMGAGEFIGLVGPNGAGKSTMLRALAGANLSLQGEICVAGDALGAMTYAQRAHNIAWLSQSRTIAWNLLAEDLVALGRYVVDAGDYNRLGEADRAQVDRAMALTGSAVLKGRHVLDVSGGEQARLHLARMLAAPAKALLLDEPCAALDIAHQFDLMEVLRSEASSGRLVLAALHDLALAERYCSRIIVMHAGSVVADGPPEVALDHKILKEVFGVRRGAGGSLERIL